MLTTRKSEEAATVYLNAAQVRSRYGGMSDIALWRWLDDAQLGFPRPLVINRRRFWDAAALAAWERRQAALALGGEHDRERRPEAT